MADEIKEKLSLKRERKFFIYSKLQKEEKNQGQKIPWRQRLMKKDACPLRMRGVLQSEKKRIFLREQVRFLALIFLCLDKGLETRKEIQPVFEDKLAANGNFEVAQVYTLVKPIQVMCIHFGGGSGVSRHEIHI